MISRLVPAARKASAKSIRSSTLSSAASSLSLHISPEGRVALDAASPRTLLFPLVTLYAKREKK